MGLEPTLLGAKTSAMLADRNNALVLSIASVWEIAIKASSGKLSLPFDAQTYVRTFLPASQAALLDLKLEHVFALTSLPHHHGDPFDRILVAQAQVEGIALLTADQRLLAYPVAKIDARR